MKTLFLSLFVSLAVYGADTKNIDKTLPLSATGSVTLESHNGSIRVHTWNRAEIEIHARIDAGGTSTEDQRRFDQTTVEIDATSGSVRIKSKFPDWNFSWWNWNNTGSNPQIHYTITAPATARWAIRDHNSTVEMRDVNAPLSLEKHNGSARLVNLGGPLELSAHNGDFHVDFSTFKGATLDMHNGSAELVLPSSSRFELRSSSHNGRVDSDFAVLTRTMGRRRDQNVEGSVNGGGPSLRLSSHNAHFRLRAK
jgi:DUF4097 and DUF4098 domain-containing protein YvlB